MLKVNNMSLEEFRANEVKGCIECDMPHWMYVEYLAEQGDNHEAPSKFKLFYTPVSEEEYEAAGRYIDRSNAYN